MKKILLQFVKTLLFSGVLFTAFAASAQNGAYTFPQNVTYTYGRMPNNPSSTDAMDAYNYWKQNFITSSGSCGERRVIWDYFNGGRGKTDRSSTVSEGIAYGMLLSAYADDKDLFDDLWAYYNKFTNGNGVMNWRVDNCGVVGQNGASDAELDVAMALIVASYQWQSDNYLNDAKNMIRIVREKEFQNFQSSTPILKPGDAFGGSNLLNPSYFSPAYYRVFADYDDSQYAQYWINAADYGYTIIDRAGGSNGLVPDWTTEQGGTANNAGEYEDDGKNFIYDAIRTPMRSGIDYLWHGNQNAQDYCSKITDWAYDNHNGGTEGLGSKYSTSGSKLSSDHSNTFVSCFAIAGMAADGNKSESDYQSFVDRAWTDNENTVPGYGQYFNATFKVIGHFVMSGNFYLPPPDECDGPSLGDDVSLCSGSNVSLDANISGVNYEWRKDGEVLVGKTAKVLQATTAGTYEAITTDNTGCTRRDKIVVYPDILAADFSFKVGPGQVLLENTTQGGFTSSSWEAASEFSTEVDGVYDYTGDGTVDITLTVSNSGFGCTDTDSKTKTIVLGGEGWAVDDFNVSENVTAWIANTSSYSALPKIKCSAEATTADCPNNPCGFLEIDVKAGASQWDPFGVNFNDGADAQGNPTQTFLDIEATPYVSMRIKLSQAAEIGIGLNDGIKTSSRIKVNLPANEWVTLSANDLDFGLAAYAQGWNNDSEAMEDMDYTNIGALQFFPNEFETFSGTIEIDWIIVGAKSLDAPTFDIKRDVDGLPVYEDPDGDEVYTTVPSWVQEVIACEGTAEISAISCSAEEYRWYQGGVLVAEGMTATLSEGDYTIELVNQGGVTTDEVTVVAPNLVADFNVDQENYDVHFVNNSTGFTSHEWSYGDIANDIAESTTWDVGYHSYAEAGEGVYTVGITVFNSTCDLEETITKTIDIVCAKPSDIAEIVGEDMFCAGSSKTYSIADVTGASAIKWFVPTGAEITGFNDTDTTSTEITVSFPAKTSGNVKVDAYNVCGSSGTTLPVSIDDAPVATVSVTNSGLEGTLATTAVASTYAWTVNGSAVGDKKSETYTFPDEGTYTVCVSVENDCGSDSKCDEDVTIAVIGLNELSASDVNVYPTSVSDRIMVDIQANEASNYLMTISDVQGKVVLQTEISTGSNITDLSGLEAGYYNVLLQNEQGAMSTKIVKE